MDYQQARARFSAAAEQISGATRALDRAEALTEIALEQLEDERQAAAGVRPETIDASIAAQHELLKTLKALTDAFGAIADAMAVFTHALAAAPPASAHPARHSPN